MGRRLHGAVIGCLGSQRACVAYVHSLTLVALQHIAVRATLVECDEGGVRSPCEVASLGIGHRCVSLGTVVTDGSLQVRASFKHFCRIADVPGLIRIDGGQLAAIGEHKTGIGHPIHVEPADI